MSARACTDDSSKSSETLEEDMVAAPAVQQGSADDSSKSSDGNTESVGSGHTGHKRALPRDFQPGKYNVICSRGSESFNHDGNKRLRKLIDKHLPKYGSAGSKLEKSMIVSALVDVIKETAGGIGGFVRRDKVGKAGWYEVTDKLAREKVGQAFRAEMRKKAGKPPYKPLAKQSSPPSSPRDQRRERALLDSHSETVSSSGELVSSLNSTNNCHVSLNSSPLPPESSANMQRSSQSSSRASAMLAHAASRVQLEMNGRLRPQPSGMELLRHESCLLLQTANVLPSVSQVSGAVSEQPLEPEVYARLYRAVMTRQLDRPDDASSIGQFSVARNQASDLAISSQGTALGASAPFSGMVRPDGLSVPSHFMDVTGQGLSPALSQTPLRLLQLQGINESEKAAVLERLRRFR